MIPLVKSEFRKLFSTQVWFWLLLASMALAGLGTWGTISGKTDEDLTTQVRDIFTAASAFDTYVPLFVLGVLAVTTEFRYQTITPTLLATPSRWVVVGAKMVTYVLLSIGYSIACIVVGLVIAVPWLSHRNIQYSFSDQWGALLSIFGVLVLLTLFGIGAGALLRNQVVAVTIGVIFLVVLGNLLIIIPGVKYAYPYLPNGLINAMLTRAGGERTFNDVTLLSIGAGAGVLVLWGVGMAILGAGITMNRDIT